MNRAAIFFLILLRLAIGWHFFFEGVQKVESVRLGETATSKPFSSAAYFREATGPAAAWSRRVLGDPDAEALGVLLVVESADKDAALTAPHERAPPALHDRWEELLAKYDSYYGFDTAQGKEAAYKLRQAEDTVVLWLTGEDGDAGIEVVRKFDSGEVKQGTVPVPELINDYRSRFDELRGTAARKPWVFGKDVEKTTLGKKKAESASRRALLMAGVEKHTRALARSLNLIVAQPVLVPLERLDNHLVTATELQKKAEAGKPKELLKTAVEEMTKTAEAAKDLRPAVPEEMTQAEPPLDPAALAEALKSRAEAVSSVAERLKSAAKDAPELASLADAVKKDADELAAASQKLPEVTPLPVESKADKTLAWMDFLTRWGLTVVGGCLLIGLFTRTNAWLAAGFLLMTYLAVPPWPWLPAAGPSEGNYLFVNKNLVELLALCVLGVTASGRWFGVDAVFSWAWTSMAGEKK